MRVRGAEHCLRLTVGYAHLAHKDAANGMPRMARQGRRSVSSIGALSCVILLVPSSSSWILEIVARTGGETSPQVPHNTAGDLVI